MREKFKQILEWLNIKPDENQKWLLLSTLFSGLLVTYSNPTLTKAIISALPAEWLAISALFGSISGLVIGMVWQGNVRKSAIKYFALLAISESVIGCVLAMYLAFVGFNAWVLAIVSLIYTSFISEFVGKCVMAFKAKLYNDKEREIYDNNLEIVSSIVCIIGFAFALLFLPSLKLSLFLWGICCILDDIGWIYVYLKNKKLLQTIE